MYMHIYITVGIACVTPKQQTNGPRLGFLVGMAIPRHMPARAHT